YVDGAMTDVKTETAYRFSVTVDSGSKISVGLGKEGYVDSGRTVVQPMIKLKSPSVTFKDKEGKDYNNRPLKYQMVTVTANDPGVTLYYRVSDGDSAYSGVYETPLEFRQTGSIEVWAMKENYETSDHKTVSVKVTYDIGDLGPSGGIIVSTAGGMFDDWKYIELAPVRADGSQYKYGYYAKKDDSEALKVFDIGKNEDQEIGNGDYYTRQLVMTMTGHAYGAIDSSWKIRPNVAGERITKTAASVADSFVYELKTKVNGRTLSFADWYLPNRTELVYILQRQLNGTINSSVLVKGNYWSTEESEDSRGAATLVIFDPESKTKKVSEFTSAAKSNMGYVLLLRKFK
ncbi:MAG: hypothetical protein LIR25_02300, partial [bacterium]|nr:hypothetical protein [bacterium]